MLSRPIPNQPTSSFLRNFLQYTEKTNVKPASSNSIAGKLKVSSNFGWNDPLQTPVFTLAISPPLALSSEISTNVSEIEDEEMLKVFAKPFQDSKRLVRITSWRDLNLTKIDEKKLLRILQHTTES